MTPKSSATGENTIHTITWTTVTPIDVRGQFIIYYKPDFDLAQLIMATTVDSATMDGRLNIDDVDTSGQDWHKVYISRKDRTTGGIGAVGINLALIGNPDPGDYSFRLETFAAGVDPDATPPEDSGTTTITITEPITSFQLTAGETNPRAGESFLLSVSNAVDAEGNPADGIINVSFENGMLQDHAAPDGTLPALVSIAVQNGSGSANQTLYLDEAGAVRLRGQVDGGTASALTSQIQTRPGELGSFSMIGYPSTTTAGLDFGAGVTVSIKAFDKWLNPKVDYNGSVYFDSDTDANASFVRNRTNPYNFTGGEDGEAYFNGQLFEFRTSGNHTFSVWNYEQTVSHESEIIEVLSGSIQSFTFETIPSQSAGQAFALNVINARDNLNNPASGTITVSLLGSGDHTPPNGQQPVLNNIQVYDGSGSAFQSLVKTETIQFRGEASSTVSNTSNVFTVRPAELGGFELSGYPQTTQTDEFFTQDVTVTAFDKYGNPKTDFSQTVSFSSSDPSPNVALPPDYKFVNSSSHAFSGNLFKLISIGSQTISVTNGVYSGTTDPITVTGPNDIQIQRVETDAVTVSRGQSQVTVSMDVLNNAAEPFEQYTATLSFRSGPDNKTSDYIVQSSNSTGTIPAGEQRTISFLVDVKASATLGDITLDGAINGYYSGVLNQAPNANVTDMWQVQTVALVQIESANVVSDSIPKGSSGNEIRAILINNGGVSSSADASIESISFAFTDQLAADVSASFSVTASPTNPTIIAGDDTSEFVFYLASDADAPNGTITMSMQVDYQDVNLLQTETYLSNALDSFVTINTAAIRLVSITPENPTATRGQTQPFPVEMEIRNDGESTLEISFDHSKTFLRFRQGGGDSLSSDDIVWPGTLKSGGRTIAPGKTDTLQFWVNQIQTSVPAGDYTIFGRVESVNGIYSTSELSNVYGQLRVQDPDNVIIHQVVPSLQTATVNDDTSPWQVSVVLQNSGGSDVMVDYANSSLVNLAAMGFNVGTPVMASGDATLSGGELDTLIFPINRTGAPSGSVTIDPNIQFEVINTSQIKNVRASDAGKEGSVLLQDAAVLEIVRVNSSVNMVSPNQSPDWTVAVVVRNSGQASVEVDFSSIESTWIGFYKDSFLFSTFNIQRPTALAGTGSTQLGGGQQDSLLFRITSNTAETGTYKIHASVRGIETNRDRALVYSTLTNPTDIATVQVVSRANISYVANSIEPVLVVPGRPAAFQLMVENSGGAEVVLDPNNTTFTIDAGAQVFSARLDDSFAAVIPGNGTLLLHFIERTVSSSITPGTYGPVVQLNGLENNLPFNQTLDLLGETVTVGEEGEITLNYLQSSVATVTQGQTRAWTINVGVTNNSAQTLKLKQTNVVFNAGTTDVSDKFQISVGDTLANGGQFLASGQSSAVPIKVVRVNQDAPQGDVLISSTITMSDEGDTGVLYEGSISNKGKVTVQTPAVLDILSFIPSQRSVTRGQTENWTIGARVRNTGQSAVIIDANTMDLDLESLRNDLFDVTKPTTFINANSDTLWGETEDSLYFQVNRVDVSLQPTIPGVRDSLGLVGFIGTQVVNTGQSLVKASETVNVAVQDSARVRIEKLEAMIESNGAVNAGGEFYLRALVKNSGPSTADFIKKAAVKVNTISPGYTFEAGDDTSSVFNLAPGESGWTAPIKVLTPAESGRQGQFSVDVSEAIARNTNGPARVDPPGPEYAVVSVTTQSPAIVRIDSVSTSKKTISTGSTLPWTISVPVRNSGDGIVELYETKEADISIYKPSGELQSSESYRLEPQPIGPNKRLAKDQVITLQYIVKETWRGTGEFKIKVSLEAKELNNTTEPLLLSDSTTIMLSNTAALRIRETKIDTANTNVDENGIAHVNTNQEFVVRTLVRNESGNYIQNIQLILDTPNSTVVQPDTQVIDLLDSNNEDWVSFTVRADSDENLSGEVMEAQIILAQTGDGGDARRLPAIDSMAVAKIYTPAQLRITETKNLAPNPLKHVSLGQNFNIRVKVMNDGSEKVRNTALRLSPLQSLVTIQEPVLSLPDILDAGEVDSVDFVINVGSQAGRVDFEAHVESAIGLNSRQQPTIRPATDDTTFALLKPGADLQIEDVITSENLITAGDKNHPWLIKVAVSNTGEADLEFVSIADTNLTFHRNGELDEDYKVVAPSGLESAGNFVLKADSTDTLVYTIRQNGGLAGLVDIKVVLNAVDLNTNKDLLLSASGNATVDVSADVAVRIDQTNAVTNVQDNNGFFLVNRGREFTVSANIRTGQFGGVDSVIIKLTSDGNSFTDVLYDTIETIEADAVEKANFTILADDSWDSPTGEIVEQFSTEIVHALVKGDTSAVVPRDPVAGADVAKVRIQNPAELSYNLQVGHLGDALVQVGEDFTVVAKMKNLGRAPIGDGQISITPPDGYLVKKGLDFLDSTVVKSFSWPLDQDTLEVSFLMQAPATVTGPDSIRAQIAQLPLDLNSDAPVLLGEIDSVVVVRAVESALAIIDFEIIDPSGARDGTLSTEQLFTVQAIVQSSQNLADREVSLTLPTLSERYELRPPQVVRLDAERDTIQWIIQAPTEPTSETHEITLNLTGGDPGEYPTVRQSVQITRVERKVALALQDLEIEPKGVLQESGEAYFTVGQTATIKARVENSGDAGFDGTGQIQFDPRESGLELVSGSSAVQDFFDDGVILWEVEAPDAIIDGRDIQIRIMTDALSDSNSNKPVTVTKGVQELVVYVNEGGVISEPVLTFLDTENNPIDSVSSGQTFKVKAIIETEGVKDNEIRASLYSENGVFEIDDFEKVIPSSGSHEETWAVLAPVNYKDSDHLYVKVEAVDAQSEQLLNRQSEAIFVPVVQRTTFDFEPYISYPEALKDRDKLSTEQRFSITAEITHNGADFDREGEFTVELSAPQGFDFAEDEIKTKTISAQDFADTGASPTWTLYAPAEASDNLLEFNILVRKLPNDIFSKQEATAIRDNILFPVRTVDKARVYFDAYLHDNMISDSASVRSGNDFKITAWLNNIGAAGLTGTFQVKLTIPSSGVYKYEFVDSDSIKTVNVDTLDTDEMSWMVRAPRYAPAKPDTFYLQVLELPDDEYARTTATMLDDSTTIVQVFLETGALIVNDYPVRTSTGVVRGENDVPVLGLTVKNKDASGTTKSFLNGIYLSIRDKVGNRISPQPMISRIAAAREGRVDTTIAFAETTITGDTSQVYLDFTADPVTIVGSITDSIKIVVDIPENAETNDFRITIDSTSAFVAIDEFDIPLQIADSTGIVREYLGISSMMAVLMDAELDKSFFNYPNPFGRADDPTTSFVYYLKEDSDVKIHIYTLTGELVKTWNFTQAEYPDLTTAGLHQGHAELMWDGRNGMEQPVLNGVYLAYISTNYGEQAMTKIAVVR